MNHPGMKFFGNNLRAIMDIHDHARLTPNPRLID